MKKYTRALLEYSAAFLGFLVIVGLLSGNVPLSGIFIVALLAGFAASLFVAKIPKTVGFACLSLSVISGLNLYMLVSGASLPLAPLYVVPLIFVAGLILAVASARNMTID